MKEKDLTDGIPNTQDERPAITEQEPAIHSELPCEPEQAGNRKRYTVRERAQINSIQRRKKRTAAAGNEEKRGGRYRIVEKRDIWYRGPLSYRHMMILGWLCVVLSQVSFILSTAGKLDPAVSEGFTNLIAIGNFVGPFFMPLMLLANFSRILSSKQQFKTLLLKFGCLSVALGLAMPLILNHYIDGLADAANRLNPALGKQFMVFVENQILRKGYIAYNIFIDLFLCTLFMFFLTYHFKRPLKRKWVIGFRLLAILPVAYELGSIVLKTLCNKGDITLPLYVSPFLTTKPPMMFVAFISLALFIKRRERIFLKNDRSYEEYGHFLETNANSLHFSIYAFVIFIAAALIDLVLLYAFAVTMESGDALAAGEIMSTTVYRVGNILEAAEIGKSSVLLYIAPLVMLYSYTRKHKNTMIDMAIPMIGIAAIVVIYTEAFFQTACQIPDMLNMFMQSKYGIDITTIDISELEQILATPMK